MNKKILIVSSIILVLIGFSSYQILATNSNFIGFENKSQNSLRFNKNLENTEEESKTDDLKSEEIELPVINITDIDQTRQSSDVINTGEGKDEYLVSSNVDQERVNSNSGMQTIKIDNNEQTSTYYTVSNDGEIKSEIKSKSDLDNSLESDNIVEVVNNKIIATNSGLIRTNGGYDQTLYMYSTLEDASNQKSGTSISGGGYEGTYHDTIEYNNQYYVQMTISGFTGYMSLEDVTIIPSNLVKSKSYYTNNNGDWTYYSSIDPLTSDSYEEIIVGSSPEWAEVGVKYYTNDDINYYTTNELNGYKLASEEIMPYNSSETYFQNLSFRSKSNYTASDYKNYLNSKGHTDSQYYNSTSAFIDAQNLEYMNSMMMFAFANHESAYGTSTYSKRCNNFFGRGAYDSSPDNACIDYGYDTPRDGILAQAIFMQTAYFDPLDWKYNGTHFGNKTSGINVKYASDPDWGKKNSSHTYNIDQYLGGKEDRLYTLLKMNDARYVFKESGLDNKVKINGDSINQNTYDLVGNGDSSASMTNVVVLDETSSAYKVWVPTAVNTGGTCQYTPSAKGSYPNYNGTSNISVPTGTAHYACDYDSWEDQEYWIGKENTSIINEGSYGTETYDVIKEEDDTGKLVYKFYLKEGTNKIIYGEKYNDNNQVYKYYEYYPGTEYNSDGSHGKNLEYMFHVKAGTDEIKYATGYNEKTEIVNYYEYYPGTKYGSHSKKIKYVYKIKPGTQEVESAFRKNTGNKVNRYYEYYPGTQYGAHSNKIKYQYDVKAGTKELKEALRKNSNNKVDRYYKYYPGTQYGAHSNKIKYQYDVKAGTKELQGALRKNSSNKVDRYYEYYPNSQYGSSSKKIKYEFNVEVGTKTLINAYKYSENGNKIIKYLYYPNTQYGNHSDKIKEKIYL